MVYGVLTMINFAHGDVFMIGAFACLALVTMLPVTLPFVVILILAMLITALLGALLERFAYRPLRNAPRVSAIITALGCGLVIQNTMLGFSPYSKAMPTLFQSKTFHIWGITISTLQILIIGISVFLMLALDFLIRKTRYGIAMRAVASNAPIVPLMGVPVDRVIALTFALGAALGGAAGMLYGLAYPVISATMGAIVGWKAFVAAVIGGIGNIRGAVLGAYLLGSVEILTIAYLPSTYRDLIAYSLLLVVLIIKPHGLLGTPPITKV